MPKKKSDEEKRQEVDAKASAKFFDQEKANYEKRMKLADETNAANSKEVVEENKASEDSDDNVDLKDDQHPSDENFTVEGDDQDENSEENKKGE